MSWVKKNQWPYVDPYVEFVADIKNKTVNTVRTVTFAKPLALLPTKAKQADFVESAEDLLETTAATVTAADDSKAKRGRGLGNLPDLEARLLGKESAHNELLFNSSTSPTAKELRNIAKSEKALVKLRGIVDSRRPAPVFPVLTATPTATEEASTPTATPTATEFPATEEELKATEHVKDSLAVRFVMQFPQPETDTGDYFEWLTDNVSKKQLIQFFEKTDFPLSNKSANKLVIIGKIKNLVSAILEKEKAE